MIQVLTVGIICLTVAAVVLPVTFLIALSLPHASEFRKLMLRVCYAGFALLAVGYFAIPTDAVPDVLFPIGFVNDAVALGLGYMSFRRAMKPANNDPTLCN